MKKRLKWAFAVLVVLAIAAGLAYLYFIPPFFILSPETFATLQQDAAPGVDNIGDPAERLIAARGRYLVTTAGCFGCHHTPTPQGPDYERFLAGGLKFQTREGTYVSRNLTPDPETGIARRSNDEIKRVLRSGVFPDGHLVSYRTMPWGGYSWWTEEDLHAVVVYLRHLSPVRHRIPEPTSPQPLGGSAVIEEAYGGRDYGGE
jgi:hypothetical protein